MEPRRRWRDSELGSRPSSAHAIRTLEEVELAIDRDRQTRRDAANRCTTAHTRTLSHCPSHVEPNPNQGRFTSSFALAPPMSTHRHRTRPARVKHEHVMHRSMPRRAQAGLRWPAHRSRARIASPRSLTILAAHVSGSAAGQRRSRMGCCSTAAALTVALGRVH